MLSKITADQVLLNLIDYLLTTLEEGSDEYGNPLSEKAAIVRMVCVACLELIQMWEFAEENGLDFNIEENYPV